MSPRFKKTLDICEMAASHSDVFKHCTMTNQAISEGGSANMRIRSASAGSRMLLAREREGCSSASLMSKDIHGSM